MTHQLRWLVRLELDREPKFGETRQEVTVWAVRPYVDLGGDKRRVGRLIGAYPYRALSAAHNRALAECKTYYDTQKGIRS